MADQKLQIVIDAKDKSGKAFKEVDSRMNKLSGNLKKIGIAFAAIAGVSVVVGKKFLDAAADFEQTQIAFTTMLGSAEEAAVFLEKLAQFAAKTPFELKEVEKGAKGLLAFGINTESILPTLKSLGDVSAGLSVPIERLILNYGQVFAQTKLTGRELRDFAIAGVPLLGELADMLGVSKAQISEMVSAGEIGFPIVEEAFARMTSEGGKFNNLMDAQSKTFSGAMSNLRDQIDLFMRNAGGPLIEMGKIIVNRLTDIVEAARLAGGIFELFREKIGNVLSFIDENTGLITVFKTAFDNIATVFKVNLLPVLKQFWDAIQPIMPFLKVLATVVGVILLGALIALVKFIEVSVIVTMKMLEGTISAVTKVIEFFKMGWDNVVTVLSKVITFIDTLIEKIKKLNILQRASSFVSKALGFGGERAAGGPVNPGKSFLVGERGPELFTPSQTGNIIPNNRLGGGTTINIVVNGDVTGQDIIERVGDALVNKLKLSTAVVG